MSRSRRHIPICAVTTARSEKDDKRIWHRRMRARLRQWLYRALWDAVPDPVDDEVSNPWDMDKDGRQIFDPVEWPQLMRK